MVAAFNHINTVAKYLFSWSNRQEAPQTMTRMRTALRSDCNMIRLNVGPGLRGLGLSTMQESIGSRAMIYSKFEERRSHVGICGILDHSLVENRESVLLEY